MFSSTGLLSLRTEVRERFSPRRKEKTHRLFVFVMCLKALSHEGFSIIAEVLRYRHNIVNRFGRIGLRMLRFFFQRLILTLEVNCKTQTRSKFQLWRHNF